MIETVPSGTVLHGRYRIERVLGSGGFGHVYLAVDIVNNQQFAVKEYLVTGATGQEQLKHEAKVLRNLNHPNLPAFQDAFIEHGRYYVVLNYIEGNDLTDLIRVARQRNDVIPIVQMLTWVLAICDAVMFLHSQQPTVIHRDIKPDNIRITPVGTAVLVDLGNAKAIADGARTLFFIRHQGTPGYAPPEQYPGGSGTDARSDIYALGGTLYFALTMHEPPSVSLRNQSIQQGRPNLPTLQEHLANNPAPETPEEQAARQFRLGVTKPGKPVPRHSYHIAQLGALPPPVIDRLNAIIQRAMALKPRDRYQYVADFANDLKQVLKALPPPPGPGADPHSTQPDLPGIYDALMEAKEQKEQADRQGQGPAGPQFTTNVAPQCPRCGNQLVSQATFCPRCGTAMSGPAPVRAETVASGMKDVSAEQTVLIKPAQMRQTMTASAVAPPAQPLNTRSFAPTPASAGQHSATAMQQIPPVSQARTRNPQPLASPDLQSHMGQIPASPIAQNTPMHAKWDTRLWILLLVIIVLVIVAIVLIVLIQQKQQPHALLQALVVLASLQTTLPLHR